MIRGLAGWRTGVVIAVLGLSALSAWLWPLGLTAFVTLLGGSLFVYLRRPGVRLDPVLLALLVFMAWAMASSGWSPVFAAQGPLASYDAVEAQTWLKLPMQAGFYLAFVLAAWRMSPHGRSLSGRVVAFGAVALAGVMLIEGLTQGGLYIGFRELIGDPIRPDLGRRNSAQATYVLALMYWPALRLLHLEGRVRAGLVLSAGAWVSPLLLGAAAPVAALIVSGLALLGLRLLGERRQWGVIGLGALIAVAILAMPWIVLAATPLMREFQPSLGASWAARIDIWVYAAQQVPGSVWIGQGLDASRLHSPDIPLHPHAAPLQVWLELGLVGALLFAALWLAIFDRLAGLVWSRATNWLQAVGASLVYAVIGALSFGVWQEWWLAAAALTAVWCGLAGRATALPFAPR